MTIRDVLEEAAADLDGVDEVEVGEGIEWRAGERLFAVATDDTAEFALDPLVARAAVRTPDATPSARGADWVRFSPSVLDDAAIDRAEAWFMSAWRLVTR